MIDLMPTRKTAFHHESYRALDTSCQIKLKSVNASIHSSCQKGNNFLGTFLIFYGMVLFYLLKYLNRPLFKIYRSVLFHVFKIFFPVPSQITVFPGLQRKNLIGV